MLIATAGHIDHGKTALVHALTGVETDRLPEEKARGISIDLGFAYWRPDDGPMIGFIDVPGHKRFVRNMLAGTSAVRFALLVVAADDGIMPQTIEHLRMLDLLGVARGFVALTKSDRVDAARLAQVRKEVTALVATSALAAAPIFALSSLTGDGVAALAQALLDAREQSGEDVAHHFRMAIDRTFSASGAGTVVTGTIIAGAAAVGDTLTVAPLGRAVRVRALQCGGRPVEAASPGERCALNLVGIEVSEMHRGDWLIAPEAHAPTARIEASVTVLADRSAPLRHDTHVHVHIGAAQLRARVLVPRQRALLPGVAADVQLVLDAATAAVSGDRFVLRDSAGRVLLGGGTVLDPLASTQRRPLAERDARAAALGLPNPADKFAALANAPGVEPGIAWFARACNLTNGAMSALLHQGGYILAGQSHDIAITTERFRRLGDALVAAVAHHHREHPGEGGLPRRLARGALGEPVSADLFGTLLRDLATAERVETAGGLLRIPGHRAVFSPLEREFWRKAADAFENRGHQPIVIAELARELRTGDAAVAAMLQRRKLSGDVWQVTDSKFMLRGSVAALAAVAAELDAIGNGFTAAHFRDAAGIGRNFTIQLLEFFDRIGVTRRHGEARRMRRDWESVVGTVGLT